MSGEDLEPVTINQPLESNHSSAQCLWDLIRDGIKFSLIYQILQDVPMAATISKL